MVDGCGRPSHGLFGSGVRVWWRCGDFGRNGISLRVRGLCGLTGVGWVVSAALDDWKERLSLWVFDGRGRGIGAALDAWEWVNFL